jgi:hypothetical protein
LNKVISAIDIGYSAGFIMYIKSVLVLSIAATAMAAPDGAAKKQAKRQANLSELSVL